MYNRTVTNIENTARAVHSCNSWFLFFCSVFESKTLLCKNPNKYSFVRMSANLSVSLQVCSISPESFERFFIKLCRNVSLSKPVCRFHNSTIPIPGQSHEFQPCISCPCISPLPLKGLSSNINRMFSLQRKCAEPINQPCLPKVRSQLQITCLSLGFRVRCISPSSLQLLSLNFV